MAGKALRQLVWDIPTRLFHWLLALLFGACWWSAAADHMAWHAYFGIAICGLLIFRIGWGIFGADTARFTQFVKGPRALWSYVRPAGGAALPAALGHNPLGGLSVVALLLLLVLQTGSGLFAVDVDGIESGPLSNFVTFAQGRWAAALHGTSFTLLQALVALHIAAILFYLVAKRRNLVGPMLTGYQLVAEGGSTAGAKRASPLRLIIALVASGLLTYAIASGFHF